MSNIIEFYKGKIVLISGATGFIGKVVLEKILSALTDVERIYLLIRTKRGVTSQERIKKLLSGPVFSFNSKVKGQAGKVFAINADLEKHDLGISEEDRNKIINEVSIVIHIGASVHFHLELEDSLKINTLSTKTLLELCTQVKHLESVVYVSTTFCNIDIEICEEKVYDFKNINVNELLEQLKEKGRLNAIQNDIMQPHPNPYTFSKRLAEIVVKDFADKLPLIIVRPSMVSSAFKEPISGWIDSLNGAPGIFLAFGSGVLRVAYADKKCHPDGAPVDCVSNGIIASSWYNPLQKSQNPFVLNIAQREENKYSWEDIGKLSKIVAEKCPPKKMLWYPTDTCSTSYSYVLLATIFFHFLPACIVDGLLLLFQQRPFLINAHRRLWHAQKLLGYFSTRNFTFEIKHMEKLYEEMSEEDKKIFYGINDFHLNLRYIEKGTRCAYKYILKDDGESKDRYILFNVLYILDILVKILTLYGALWLILNVFGMTKLLTINYWCEYNCIS